MARGSKVIVDHIGGRVVSYTRLGEIYPILGAKGPDWELTDLEPHIGRATDLEPHIGAIWGIFFPIWVFFVPSVEGSSRHTRQIICLETC